MELRKNFFSRLKLLWFAGAGLRAARVRRDEALAYDTCGEEILFLTGLGSTETAPFAMGAHVGDERLSPTWACRRPVEIKLVPLQDKLEARLKGPNITPATGAARPHGAGVRRGRLLPARRLVCLLQMKTPEDGLLFRGRIAEDFKLATGTWVNVGPLRARFIAHFAPWVRDVVIAGEGRDETRVLVFLRWIFQKEAFHEKLKSLEGTGGSNRISRGDRFSRNRHRSTPARSRTRAASTRRPSSR
jgi:feruloyl-CoA synthase